MATIMVEIGVKQIKEAFQKMPIKERINLVEEFERQTRKDRWEALTKDIRKRVVKHSISNREIDRICEEVRKERYERNKGSY